MISILTANLIKNLQLLPGIVSCLFSYGFLLYSVLLMLVGTLSYKFALSTTPTAFGFAVLHFLIQVVLLQIKLQDVQVSLFLDFALIVIGLFPGFVFDRQGVLTWLVSLPITTFILLVWIYPEIVSRCGSISKIDF